MQGTVEQEVGFIVNLLHRTAHEWYLDSEKRNGNRLPRSWPPLMQAILKRLGSNIHVQEAQACLMGGSQGKRSV